MPTTPATKLAEVKNFANAFENMLRLAHAAVGGKSVIPRSPDENTGDVWIVPIFQRGPAEGHFFRRPDGFKDYDIFKDCLIGFDLSIPRVTGMDVALVVATYDLFAQEIMRIDLALDPARWEANNANLKFHHFTRPRALGAPMAFDGERGEDRAEVRYICDVGIKNDAWPTDLAAYANPGL